jgi:hypothetical protein
MRHHPGFSRSVVIIRPTHVGVRRQGEFALLGPRKGLLIDASLEDGSHRSARRRTDHQRPVGRRQMRCDGRVRTLARFGIAALLAIGLCGCGVDTAGTAATVAGMKAQEVKQAQETKAQVLQQVDAANQAAEQRLKEADGK